ncbi:alginate export family protein [Sphingomonas sp. KC8]|uniref:alginate export family protein n=1 Tax=Sphingomonas sp. KC8 TaxID=1030157 RepID=UPI0002488EA7|nr:alginate export family protein [Sphingomonas sp. KC8]ARS26651.1 hypothetical protein KC8_05025 [Sphingomonas sp. KC8]
MKPSDGHGTITGRPAVTLFIAFALFTPYAALAEDAGARDPMVLRDSDGLAIRAHLQAGLNLVGERNLFWNFAETFAPTARFQSDTAWLEAYVKPGISFTREAGNGLTVYGKGSVVLSGTLGKDAFDTGDTGRLTLEEGYLGLRAGSNDGWSFDISAGPREYKAGTGMLLANGGSSGFSRGALKLGPHKAWEMAGLAKIDKNGFTATAFFLNANESDNNDSNTRIVGGDVRYDGQPGRFVGVTMGAVLTSNAPYPQAAPGGIGVPSILPGARNGLNFVNFYGRGNPLGGALKNLFFAIDYAYEWNNTPDLSAWAGRAQIGYTFADSPWKPTLTYSYQTFSGDDPDTTKLERFDPLYYEGSPSSWSTGSKSSMVFINSNINAHQIALAVGPTQKDTITLRAARISANKLLSPIQFGQATRVEVIDGIVNPIAGVTRHHLSDDFFIEYNRIINPNTYLTAGFSVSKPGRGIDTITANKSPLWTGAFVNVVVNF